MTQSPATHGRETPYGRPVMDRPYASRPLATDPAADRRHYRHARRHARAPSRGAEQLAQALGWFSLALGLVQVAAPDALARGIGLRDDDRTRNVMRAIGLRELATGIGILTRDRPANWLWARVGGDAMDLGLLIRELASDRRRPDGLVAATAAVAGVAALDVLCGSMLSEAPARAARPLLRPLLRPLPSRTVDTRHAITINKPPDEVYRFWRDLSNLPRFMGHLESVEPIDERRSRWRAKGPAGTGVEWTAEITEDRPNEFLAWRSLDDAEIVNRGTVSFERAPGGRGTTLRVDLHYDAPLGAAGLYMAKLFGREPGQEVREDLRTLKQFLETGEVTRSNASVGRGLMKPARPTPPASDTTTEGQAT